MAKTREARGGHEKKEEQEKKDTKHAARGGCQRRSQLSLGLPFLESLLPSRGMSSLGGSSLFELSDSDQAGDGGSGGCIWKVSWFLDASDDSFLIRLPPLTPFFLLITLEKVSLSYQKRRACQGGPFEEKGGKIVITFEGSSMSSLPA